MSQPENKFIITESGLKALDSFLTKFKNIGSLSLNETESNLKEFIKDVMNDGLYDLLQEILDEVKACPVK